MSIKISLHDWLEKHTVSHTKNRATESVGGYMLCSLKTGRVRWRAWDWSDDFPDRRGRLPLLAPLRTPAVPRQYADRNLELGRASQRQVEFVDDVAKRPRTNCENFGEKFRGVIIVAKIFDGLVVLFEVQHDIRPDPSHHLKVGFGRPEIALKQRDAAVIIGRKSIEIQNRQPLGPIHGI